MKSSDILFQRHNFLKLEHFKNQELQFSLSI